MAVGRSEFLINVFRKSHVIHHDMLGDGEKHQVVSFDRGFFKFYNRESKNLMFDIFRTTRMKSYNKVKESFPQGQFTNQYPFPKEEYSRLKLEALSRFDDKKAAKEKEKLEKAPGMRELRARNQRDTLLAVLKEKTGMTDLELGKLIGVERTSVIDMRKSKGITQE
jgi:hypothetical protein